MGRSKEATPEEQAILGRIIPDQILTEVQNALEALYAGYEVKRQSAKLIVQKRPWPLKDEDFVQLRLNANDRRPLPKRDREVPVSVLIFDKSIRPFAEVRLAPFTELKSFTRYNRCGAFIGFDPDFPQVWVGSFSQGEELMSIAGVLRPTYLEEKGPTGVKDFLIQLITTGEPD